MIQPPDLDGAQGRGGTPVAQAQTQTQALAQLEAGVAALTRGLRDGDALALQVAVGELESALFAAASGIRDPASLNSAQREALALAARRVAVQREAVARASASAGRAIEVLLPATAPAAATYSSAGYAERAPAAGSAWA